MEQPLGFVTQGEIGKVCRLRKSLCDLKQLPLAPSLKGWNFYAMF